MISRSLNSRAWRRRGYAAAAACALLLAAAAGPANAGDLGNSWLRGSLAQASAPGYVPWDGLVMGATVGGTSMSSDFGNAGSSEIAYILRNTTLENEFQPSSWTTLPRTVTNDAQYGFFLGYNWQMDELVLGLDGGYNRFSSLTSQATDSIERLVSTSDGVNHDVLLQTSASLKLVDYATLRGRAGYAFGQFLPYAMLGVAIGRFDYQTTATVTDKQTGAVTGTFGPVTQSAGQDNVITAGFLAGLGMDIAIMPNVFLRGEWEYIAWGPVHSIKSNLNTGRVGLAVRF
jgi:outer membrane immunogenic protein